MLLTPIDILAVVDGESCSEEDEGYVPGSSDNKIDSKFYSSHDEDDFTSLIRLSLVDRSSVYENYYDKDDEDCAFWDGERTSDSLD